MSDAIKPPVDIRTSHMHGFTFGLLYFEETTGRSKKPADDTTLRTSAHNDRQSHNDRQAAFFGSLSGHFPATATRDQLRTFHTYISISTYFRISLSVFVL